MQTKKYDVVRLASYFFTFSFYPTWDESYPTWDGSYPTWDESYPTWDGSYPTWDGNYPTWDGSYFSHLILVISPDRDDLLCKKSSPVKI
jgi:hypothetical protein